ncbi:MAG: hypothetical protein IJU92_04715 [Spirochaetaceae bacterium]|nr:hypothetical protein [Spirochaetaceae bacterium]
MQITLLDLFIEQWTDWLNSNEFRFCTVSAIRAWPDCHACNLPDGTQDRQVLGRPHLK